MITGFLQNKYICISNKSETKIEDLARISHVLIEIVEKKKKKYSPPPPHTHTHTHTEKKSGSARAISRVLSFSA